MVGRGGAILFSLRVDQDSSSQPGNQPLPLLAAHGIHIIPSAGWIIWTFQVTSCGDHFSKGGIGLFFTGTWYPGYPLFRWVVYQDVS